MSKRLAGMGVKGYDKADPFKPTFHPDRLREPLKVKKSSVIGVSFMGDLFHLDFSNDYFYATIFHVISKCPQHTFLFLTKRPDRMALIFKTYMNPVFSNLWLGVTVENQEQADKRIPILLQIPGKHWVSVEPMLSEVNFRLHDDYDPIGCLRTRSDMLNWIVSGCESGPGRRPAETDWFRSARDQCVSAGVPYFLKQRGNNRKVVEMPELDGKIWDQVPW